MTGPVHEGTQWRTPWQRLAEDDRTRMLEELAGQIRGHLPDGTQLHRLQLRCYPRHALLRFTVPSQDGPREAYAFYAPGQLYPLDWKLPSLRAFDEVALELNSETQAEDYLRVTTWGFVREHGRSFIIEDADQLRLDKNVELDVATRERLTELRPLHRVPRHAGDPNDRFRFRCALLYGHDLKAFDFTVEPLSCEGLEADDDFEPIELPGLEDRVQSDRFFVLVRETSLTASRFLRQLRRGPVHQARVIEPVSLRNEAFEEPVILSQVTFEHGADFAGARFESGLTLESCVCEGQLSLRDTSIAGSLDAARLTFHRDGSRREDGSLEKETRFGRDLVDLDGSGMKVEGSVYLEGLRTLNMVDLGRISVAGDVRIGGSRIGRPRDPSAEPSRETALRLDNGSVGGDLDLVYCRQARYRLGPETGDAQMDEVIPGFSTPSTVVRGRLAARGMDVSGEVELGGLRCEGSLDLSGLTSGANLSADADGPHRRLIVLGSFGLENATIEGSVRLHGAHVGGSLRLSSCRIRGSVFGRTYAAAWGRVHPLHVGGDLVLSGTHVDDVDLQGARVGGITMITGELGRLRLMPGVETHSDPGGSEGDDGPRRVQSIPLRAGSIRLVDLTIRKRMSTWFELDDGGGLDLENLDCGGDLELWYHWDPDADLEEGEAWAAGMRPDAEKVRTVVPGEIRCMGLRIGGRAVLTNVSAGGRILLKNCEIAQDLACSSYGGDPHSLDGRTRTECRHMDLELTTCGGDVDFSGLAVTGAGEESSLHARQLQVSGRILFARPLGEHQDQMEMLAGNADNRVQAEIEGNVDLSAAQAVHLLVTGSGIGGRLDLERGRFRRLQVLEPGLLARHNVSNLEVDRWDMPDDQLLVFLDGSEPFDRAAYVEIERVLRNRAQDAEADRVYRAMRARAIREARYERQGVDPAQRPRPASARKERWWTAAAGGISYLLRTLGSRLQGLLYGWGTLYWAPLLLFSGFFVPFTWALLSSPHNVVPSPELSEAAGVVGTRVEPSAVGVEWGPSDGFWLTVRYHVPMVPLTAREDFRPSQELARLDVARWRVDFLFSAESYAFSVYLLNWILWPLFLVGLARRIVRETT